MSELQLSLAEARRIALAAQGFDRPRPARPGRRHIRNVIRQLGLLQLDFVNVLLPAHYQVLFSRLGPYNRALLHDLVYRRREFTEQWAHEACIIPMETWPLLRHRMATRRFHPYGFDTFLDAHPAYFSGILDEVRARGPLTPADLSHPDGVERRLPQSWFGTVPRAALEAHFARGVLAIAERRSDFARIYDLAERVIPEEHRTREIGSGDADRELVRLVARALGIGVAADIADYYRMQVRLARRAIEALVVSGELRRARVEGWREGAFLYARAIAPERIEATTLLSPFDPLIWFRRRTARLLNFEYRFEIFVPEAKLRWGRYVLPFLIGERLAARVDLKSDRESGSLLVLAAFAEPWVGPGDAQDEVAAALAGELWLMTRWLGFHAVQVTGKGAFAKRIAAAVRLSVAG